MTYLEFTELEDYLAHLREHDANATRLGITWQTGAADANGFRTVTYYAAATAQVDDHIATYGTVIYQTLNLNLRVNDERARAHETLHAKFDRVREELERAGVNVTPGVWRIQPPAWLGNDLGE
jgi:hypothetical protein